MKPPHSISELTTSPPTSVCRSNRDQSRGSSTIVCVARCGGRPSTPMFLTRFKQMEEPGNFRRLSVIGTIHTERECVCIM